MKRVKEQLFSDSARLKKYLMTLYYMGFSNGEPKPEVKAGKVEKGERRIGFALTADEHYHLKGKRLTNVSAPVHNHDATTKKFVTDLLKTKAGTAYVNNELTKKANQSNVNKALDLKADKFELTALKNKVNTLEATVGELQKALLRERRQSV